MRRNKTFDAIVNTALEHCSFSCVGKKFAEHFRQLLFAVMICSDVEDNGVISGVIQKALIAFIGFKHKVSAVAAAIVSDA